MSLTTRIEIMVQVLVVNAMASPKSLTAYSVFMNMVRKTLKRDADIVERAVTDIADFVIDWEYETLEEHSKSIMKHFDKLELVFVIGDRDLVPWDPKCHLLVILLHMCNYVEKPVLSVGSGALHSMYSLCTQGARFDFINGPRGEKLNRLPTYSSYSIGTPPYPCGWLENETGDVYSYDPDHKAWRPVCNVGMNRLPMSGRPREKDTLPPEKKFGSDKRLLVEQEKVEVVKKDGDIMVNLRNSATRHYSFRGIEKAKFVLSNSEEWNLNFDGALPAHDDLMVLADGPNGPAVVAYKKNLLLTCDVNRGKSYYTLQAIFYNFVKEMLGKVGAVKEETDERALLTHKVFGSGRVDEELWQPTPPENRKVAPTLAATMVSTKLSQGPTLVQSRFGIEQTRTERMMSPRTAAQANNVIRVAGTADGFDYEALTSPRIHKSMGKKVPVAKKKSHRVRRKRLDIFLAAQGHPEMQAVNKKAYKLAEKHRKDPEVFGSPHVGDEPDSARVFFGDNNLSLPRNKEQRPTLDSPWNAPPPKIDFSRPHTAGGRWQSAAGQSSKQPLKSKGWGEYMRENDAYDMSRLGNTLPSIPKALNATTRDEARAMTADAAVVPELRDIKASLSDNFIPEKHPNLNKFRVPEGLKKHGGDGNVKCKKKRRDKDTSTAEGQTEEKVMDGAPTTSIALKQLVISTVEKPFNNNAKYRDMEKADKMAETMHMAFQGTYTEQYRSEHEKQIYEYNEAKKKFIGEPFKTHFGKASSLPLRPQGVVGGDGKYPKQPSGMVAPLAVDWNMFVDRGELGALKWK